VSELPDTPSLGRKCCPGCEPEADEFAEILIFQWCHLHAPPLDGSADGAVSVDGYLSGNVEADGVIGRAFANVIHRPGAR
jgi:hypothetical protein